MDVDVVGFMGMFAGWSKIGSFLLMAYEVVGMRRERDEGGYIPISLTVVPATLRVCCWTRQCQTGRVIGPSCDVHRHASCATGYLSWGLQKGSGVGARARANRGGGSEKRSVVMGDIDCHARNFYRNFHETTHSKMRETTHRERCVASCMVCPTPPLCMCV